MHACRTSANGEQIAQYVTLFLGGAGTAKHIIAIALEPFFDFIGAREALRISRWGQGADHFACCRVLTRGCRIAAVTGGATPFPAVGAGVLLLAPFDREAGKRRIFLLGLGSEAVLKVNRGFGLGGEREQGSDGGRDDQTHAGYPVVNSVSGPQDTRTT